MKKEVSTLGIDLASQPQKTAACRILWSEGEPIVEPLVMPCDDEALDSLIKQSGAVGIDAPLGWPEPFTNAMADWQHHQWNHDVRDQLRFRLTDRKVKERTGKQVLSVSSDLIALPAMRAQAILRRFGVKDRSGDGRFFEVYPAGSLKVWGWLPVGHSYKHPTKGLSSRKEILGRIREYLPMIPDEFAETDDALDALLAAITARLAFLHQTVGPNHEEIELARKEGWIHLPLGDSWDSLSE